MFFFRVHVCVCEMFINKWSENFECVVYNHKHWNVHTINVCCLACGINNEIWNSNHFSFYYYRKICNTQQNNSEIIYLKKSIAFLLFFFCSIITKSNLLKREQVYWTATLWTSCLKDSMVEANNLKEKVFIFICFVYVQFFFMADHIYKNKKQVEFWNWNNNNNIELLQWCYDFSFHFRRFLCNIFIFIDNYWKKGFNFYDLKCYHYIIIKFFFLIEKWKKWTDGHHLIYWIQCPLTKIKTLSIINDDNLFDSIQFDCVIVVNDHHHHWWSLKKQASKVHFIANHAFFLSMAIAIEKSM